MKKLTYEARFVTPAFLGNAEQDGQWRTPPFKALLRQWWRVVYAAEHEFRINVAEMRREEGLLFGNAWIENQFCKSLVRIRLDRWAEGKLRSWQGLERQAVDHPEAERAHYKVGPHAYLGFGPLDGSNRTKLAKANAAIQAGEAATLSIAMPDKNALRIEHALWLMNLYGTLGGRSRNGWGSITMESSDGTPPLAGTPVLRPCCDALGLDWPHAVGQDKDSRPLIWQTKSFGDWKTLMRELAVVKIKLRTQFKFPNMRPPHPEPLDRHWLSYPITRHTTSAWKGNYRLPNSVRFKARPAPDEPQKLVGVIFHVPCLPPPVFRPDPRAIQNVWQRVHAFLDDPAHGLTRIHD